MYYNSIPGLIHASQLKLWQLFFEVFFYYYFDFGRFMAKPTARTRASKNTSTRCSCRWRAAFVFLTSSSCSTWVTGRRPTCRVPACPLSRGVAPTTPTTSSCRPTRRRWPRSSARTWKTCVKSTAPATPAAAAGRRRRTRCFGAAATALRRACASSTTSPASTRRPSTPKSARTSSTTTRRARIGSTTNAYRLARRSSEPISLTSGSTSICSTWTAPWLPTASGHFSPATPWSFATLRSGMNTSTPISSRGNTTCL